MWTGGQTWAESCWGLGVSFFIVRDSQRQPCAGCSTLDLHPIHIYIFSISFSHLSGRCEISPLTKCREMSQTYVGWERHQLCVFFSSQKASSAMEGPLGFALRKFEMPEFHGLFITWGTPTVPPVLTNMCLAN